MFKPGGWLFFIVFVVLPAVAGVRRIRNPIHAARLVMQATSHVMLIGPGTFTFVEFGIWSSQTTTSIRSAYNLGCYRKTILIASFFICVNYYYCVGKLIDTVLSVHLVASECVCLLPFEANQSYNIHFRKAVLLTNAYCVHFLL